MSDDAKAEYSRMKDFLSFYFARYFDTTNLPAEKQPIAILEALEKKSIKAAFAGLRQTINDCLEMSLHFNQAEVQVFDIQFRSHGIITLSELRRRYSKRYAKILKQGRIRNETDYYMTQNVVNDPTPKTPEEQQTLEKMLLDYESSVRRSSRSPTR